MKRRTFLEALGAGCTLGPGRVVATITDPGPGQATVGPLVLVHDRLPGALRSSLRGYQPSAGAERFDLEELLAASDHWRGSVFPLPLVIGLGPRAEDLIEQLPRRLPLPEGLGLYRSGPADGAAPAEDWFQVRLAHCVSALIVVDATDPQARAAAAAWTEQLAQADVYLHARIVIEAPDDAQDADWLGALPAPTLVVRQHATALDPFATVATMLYGLPCLEQSLCGYDASALRMVLDSGPRAFTTAVRWTDRDGPTSDLATAYAALSPGDCRGAILFMSAGPADLTIDEWVEVLLQLEEWLPPDATACPVPLLIPGLAKDERALCLTLVVA